VQKCDVVVDDVSKLPPLLKSGQVDYAIMYSSTAIAHSIRSIELSPQVNLGQRDRDYGAASVTFRKLSVDSSKRVTVRGKPIVWTLSIPDRNAQPEPARRLIRFLLIDARLAMADNGLAPLSPPVFYGPRDDFGPFTDVALYGGLLTQ